LPDPGGPRHVHILATHVFVKTALGWRLAARHASVGAEPEAETASDLQATLH
jgi:ketosteroid isomerase-like protein